MYREPMTVLSDQKLRIYLNDHMAAARAGVSLFRRARNGTADDELARALASLAEEVADDRRSLSAIMKELRISERRALGLAMQTLERVSRLKPNGRLIGRSALADVIELEAMRSAVAGKIALWDALLSIKRSSDVTSAADAGRLAALNEGRLEALHERAHDQARRLEEWHRRIAGPRFVE